ncbi:MAG: DUF4870 domain-containing protein [Methanophagales archaeon]|nr:DUF4870 domain-containing protein [Methanophagales archaeon]
MEKTSLGMDENIEGLLCYVLTWLTGIVFLVLEKDNKFVRFHAMQSIATFLPLTIIAIVISMMGSAFFLGFGGLWMIFSLISTLIWILAVILWIILMIKAYQGEMYKLPIVGDFAEKQI